jgi:hypothetical protein
MLLLLTKDQHRHGCLISFPSPNEAGLLDSLEKSHHIFYAIVISRKLFQIIIMWPANSGLSSFLLSIQVISYTSQESKGQAISQLPDCSVCVCFCDGLWTQDTGALLCEPNLSTALFLFCLECVFCSMEFELRASCLLGKSSTTWLWAACWSVIPCLWPFCEMSFFATQTH